MLLPPGDATTIHNHIPGAQALEHGQFTVPCNTNASVALTYVVQLFTIDPRDLAFQALDAQGINCTSGIAGSDLTPATEWLVSVFLASLNFAGRLPSTRGKTGDNRSR